MDNSSPLYLAHQNDRKAEIHIQFRRFDEALLCHQRASELLQHAMTLTNVTKALESLKLQQEYHNKQKDIIRVKKFQFDKRKKAIEHRKRKMASEKKIQESRDQDLQCAIFRAMEEADSLLDQLGPAKIDTGDISSETPPASPSSPPLQGVKRPKDDQMVIEELHTLNMQLRTLIAQLLTQLDASERQVEMLRARLRKYEPEDNLVPISTINAGSSTNVTTASVPSDMVVSSLPYLAPLEMPHFNFDNL
ncbi:nuclear receptor-binding factor 2-like isoform X1 [Lycorma delicatula]|uniref:nuclear receptor-binding factor 2-like isoform X1 n=2 Tax=Lycorma delicatula TaxID=130591 RepID=UPI003F51A01F